MTPKDLGIQTPSLKVGADTNSNVIIEYGDKRLAFSVEQAIMLAALILRHTATAMSRSNIVPAPLVVPEQSNNSQT